MRQKLLIANWKLNKTADEARIFAGIFKEALSSEVDCLNVDLVVCPPFPLIEAVKRNLEGSRVYVGAQNVSAHVEGAFTGEVGPRQLSSIGCAFVVIGHSERRNIFGETDDLIRDKLVSIYTESSMIPVLCIGEKLDTRSDGRAVEFTLSQLKIAIAGFAPELVKKLVIAYEPVWAIGTGMNATPEDAQAMCKAIRLHIASSYNWGVASQTRILYGGSIKPANWREIVAQPDVDGGLVGGASFDPTDFYTLYQITSEK
jgi:triosephosphate isomerase